MKRISLSLVIITGTLFVFYNSAFSAHTAKIEWAKKLVKSLGPHMCPVQYGKSSYPNIKAQYYEFSYEMEKHWDDFEAVLVKVPCILETHHKRFVFVIFDPSEDIGVLVTLATPSYSVDYENNDFKKPVKSIKLTGYLGTFMISSAVFNPITLELTEYQRHGNIGNAFHEARWKFEYGQFSLKTFRVDASHDNKTEAVTLIDFK